MFEARKKAVRTIVLMRVIQPKIMMRPKAASMAPAERMKRL